MTERLDRKSIWGWMFFDWASQPFHTLLVTFIFAPYFTKFVAADEVTGQAQWGFTIAAAGIVIAILSPILGAIADTTGPRKSWIMGFSVLYVCGSAALWMAVPSMEGTTFVLVAFAIGLIGAEFAATFSNAILPDISPRADIGRISGSGWAFGYMGGLLALLFVLLMVAENDAGKTLLGLDPIGGLDPYMREGTRAVGPITAVWFAVFMIPFFAWVPDAPRVARVPGSLRVAMRDLANTFKRLPGRPNLLKYLLGSMFYRDALAGVFAFGGIYAGAVLGWSITQIGVFGILALASGAVGSWLGGRADMNFGPRPVILLTVVILLLVSVFAIGISRAEIFGLPLGSESKIPDIAFFACGALIGAAGGALQAASRTMLVHHADPRRLTEAFGIYALTGKATAYIAPASIGFATLWLDDVRLGIFVPIIVLFIIGLGFMLTMDATPKGGDARAEI